MPTSTYVPLATYTLPSNASGIVFSSIPATYRDLIFVFSGKLTATANTFWQANGDGGSNYSYVQMWGTGSGGGSSNAVASTTAGLFGANYTGQGVNIVQFLDYSATDKHKVALTRNNDGGGVVGAVASRWANNAAIHTVGIQGSFVAGSTFSLFGIEA